MYARVRKLLLEIQMKYVITAANYIIVPLKLHIAVAGTACWPRSRFFLEWVQICSNKPI